MTRSISAATLKEWTAKKKYNKDRLNRIRKKLKKLLKQQKHFEMRIRLIEEYESQLKKDPAKST
jgi:hypothetical protein